MASGGCHGLVDNTMKDASDEHPRKKFFNASMAHFSSLLLTLQKSGAVPCQHTFAKHVSEHGMEWHGTARHQFTLAKQVMSCCAVPCQCRFLPV